MKPAALLLILSISLLFSFCSTVNAEPNLISWWKFDEGSGNIAYDSAGSNNGTITGATWTTEGKINGALSFDGSDDYVALSNFTVYTNNGTISLWFKTSADFSANYGGYGYLISANNQYYSYLTIAGNGTAPYNIVGETDSQDDYYVIAMGVVPVGEWNHIVVSFNNKTAKTYLNGALVDTRTISNSLLTLNRIGGRALEFFKGEIDDVRIYNRALSAEEVEELYGQGQKAFAANPANGATGVNPDIVLHWSPGRDAASHDVYFGTNFNDVNNASTSSPEYKGSFDVNSFNPNGLDLLTTYYWRIDEVNDANLWKGNVWNFTVVSGKAKNPQPSDGQSGVSEDSVLSWSPGVSARSHDVYFGTDYNDVNNADTLSPEYKGNYDINSYDPGGLEEDTFYYWRIDEVNDPNLWKGDVWSFNTTLCVVPNVIGMTEANAITAINNASLVVGTKTYGNGGTTPIGQVYSQSPVYTGNPVDCGTTITINVASYCMKATHPDYAKWVLHNKPKCWCYAKHCRGDADGLQQGLFWVSNTDKAIFMTYLNKFPDPPPPSYFAGACADFTHSQDGGLFWVSGADKSILATYLNKVAPVPADCDSTHINFWCKPGSTTLGCP
ncbi:MAG: LamG-like jellyroll fold domain-containing protein [Sedimentisphaerales bacterium]